MGVNYREQYKPDQLEPFWPNEIIKMMVAVLCTLAIIMLFVVLPVVLEEVGLGEVVHQEQPADPHGSTPVGIKPEWYFLPAYQYLKLMPTELFGVSGKTLGVLSQGLILPIVALLPFWYRKRAHQRPNNAYRITITAAIGVVIALTIWGGWPEHLADGHEKLEPFGVYFRHKPMLFVVFGVALVVFYGLVARERRQIRAVLGDDGGQS